MPRANRFANGRTLSILLDWPLLALPAVSTAILLAWLTILQQLRSRSERRRFYINCIVNPFVHWHRDFWNRNQRLHCACPYALRFVLRE